jgi:hypothetical protein
LFNEKNFFYLFILQHKQLQILLVCLLALSGSQANYINQYGLRTLSGLGSQPSLRGNMQQQQLSSFLTAQKPSIIAAPLRDIQLRGDDNGNNGYGQQQQQQVQVVEQVASVNSGYGQQAQVVPQVQQQYGQQAQVLPQVQPQQQQYGQQAQILPQVQPQQQQYGQQAQILPQVQPQQQQQYGQQAQVLPQVLPQVQPQQQQYGQQAQILPQNHQADLGYGQQQTSAPMSPMALFMAQPAIQQLISTMVQQYHGNNLGASQEMQNTCAVGFTQPIYESTQVTETYCRCPSGTYGFTCTENFANPCLDGSIEFTAADSRVPSTYFIKCSWGIPYLNKCPAGTVRWSQELQACVADETPVQPPASSSSSSYGSYNPQPQQQVQLPKQTLRSNSY